MLVYDAILQGHEATEENARNYALGLDWQAEEQSKYTGRDHNYIDSINGIDIYYHFGADYYFFTDTEEEN